MGDAIPAHAIAPGFGAFVASDTIAKRSTEAARRCATRLVEGGFSYGMLWVEAPDRRRARPQDLDRFADALREEGLRVALWTMPRADDVAGATIRLAAAAALVRPDGVALNVERPPPPVRAAGCPEWTPGPAAALLRGAHDAVREGGWVALSSMPIRSAFARHIPWAALLCEVGMNELYRSADDGDADERDDIATIEQSISQWSAAHAILRPTIDSFLGNPARLRRVLERVVIGPAGAGPRFEGATVWKESTCDRDELRVLREHAERWGWCR